MNRIRILMFQRGEKGEPENFLMDKKHTYIRIYIYIHGNDYIFGCPLFIYIYTSMYVCYAIYIYSHRNIRSCEEALGGAKRKINFGKLFASEPDSGQPDLENNIIGRVLRKYTDAWLNYVCVFSIQRPQFSIVPKSSMHYRCVHGA